MVQTTCHLSGIKEPNVYYVCMGDSGFHRGYNSRAYQLLTACGCGNELQLTYTLSQNEGMDCDISRPLQLNINADAKVSVVIKSVIAKQASKLTIRYIVIGYELNEKGDLSMRVRKYVKHNVDENELSSLLMARYEDFGFKEMSDEIYDLHEVHPIYARCDF